MDDCFECDGKVGGGAEFRGQSFKGPEDVVQACSKDL